MLTLRQRLTLLGGLATLGGVGCGQVTQGPATFAPPLDPAVFESSVEPILVRQCSFQACHGLENKALRIYSVGKLRQVPALTLDARIQEMTQGEHAANLRSAAAFAVGVSPEESPLVRKALPAALGGYSHKGGALFSGPEDARAIAIVDWLAGRSP